MPNVVSITLSYAEKRSANYQTVEFGESVTYTLNDGEDADAVFKAQRHKLVEDVRKSADKCIERYDTSAQHRD